MSRKPGRIIRSGRLELPRAVWQGGSSDSRGVGQIGARCELLPLDLDTPGEHAKVVAAIAAALGPHALSGLPSEDFDGSAEPPDAKLNDWGGGRGVYFKVPDGHLLELMTVPQ